MTPAINSAWDVLSDIVEEPSANNYEVLRLSAVRMLEALAEARAERAALLDDVAALLDQVRSREHKEMAERLRAMRAAE